MPRSPFQTPQFGTQSAATNFRYEPAGKKYVIIQIVPTTIATTVENAAPATPNACPVTQPKIRNGARIMFRITVAVCTTMPGLKLPVPRSAALITAMKYCSDIAGMNQRRYVSASTLVSASALSARVYAPRPSVATMANSTPTSTESTTP